MEGGRQPTVAELYRGWDGYQDRLVRAIAPLVDSQLDLSPAPSLWSIRTLANHVVAIRAWWFHAWMGEGGAEFDEIMDWDQDGAQRQRTTADIVRGLEVTWSLIESRLKLWTFADLAKEFERSDPDAGGERRRYSRQYIIWHVAEHDLHHGGEISFSLGMRGLAGIDL